MSANVVDEYSDELNEGPRRIRTGCTIGRVINLCMALNFLLVMITALIVSGTLGAVNLALKESYGDRPGDTVPLKRTVCILYSTCDGDTNYQSCLFHYNQSGVCNYVEVAFGFIALIALIYIIISIVRAVLTTNISLTVFVDLGLIVLCVLVAFTTGVTISIGLSLTCKAVSDRYDDHKTCDRGIPNIPPTTPVPTGSSVGQDRDNGYYFHNSVNVAQSCGWLCFAFLTILLIMTVARIIIYFTRRRVALQENNVEDITDVLTRAQDDDDDDEAKPI